ncbi:hypothetical protein HGRIS_002717 [Hohenbuehelia grisea]|uniref:DUF6534 domain-containing protein n=1 Tax=Hohenbuehelia grisea TaxID=104357 RepID=A0ABR3JLC1_9AGAR
MVSSSFSDRFGTLLIGSYANTFLLALEVVMVCVYFKYYSNDRLLVKITVCAQLFVDVIASLGNAAGVYLYTVSHWGDINYANTQNIPFTIYLATTSVSAIIVQTFLIIRYYRLTSHKIVTVWLTMVTLGGFLGGISSAIIIAKYPDYLERSKVRHAAIIWLSCSAASDVCIASALVWHFSRFGSKFASTTSLLRSLIRMAIHTGLMTSAVAILVLILYLSNVQSNRCVAAGFCLGRVYALTMLYNLNMRKRIRASSTVNPSTSHQSTHGTSFTKNNTLGGIRVQQTSLVCSDNYRETAIPTARRPRRFSFRPMTFTPASESGSRPTIDIPLHDTARRSIEITTSPSPHDIEVGLGFETGQLTPPAERSSTEGSVKYPPQCYDPKEK